MNKYEIIEAVQRELIVDNDSVDLFIEECKKRGINSGEAIGKLLNKVSEQQVEIKTLEERNKQADGVIAGLLEKIKQ